MASHAQPADDLVQLFVQLNVTILIVYVIYLMQNTFSSVRSHFMVEKTETRLFS